MSFRELDRHRRKEKVFLKNQSIIRHDRSERTTYIESKTLKKRIFFVCTIIVYETNIVKIKSIIDN